MKYSRFVRRSKMASSRFSQPWFTRDIKQPNHRKKRAYVRARSSKTLKDFERYDKIKKSSTETCKAAYNDFITNIISPDSSSNPKRFYGFIKSKKIENHGVAQGGGGRRGYSHFFFIRRLGPIIYGSPPKYQESQVPQNI